MKKLILLLTIMMGVLATSMAQKIKVESGDLSFLKEASEVSITFEYPENMKYGKMTQQEYIDKKVKEKEKKNEGSGEKWKEAFFADREQHYEPQFIDSFDKYTGDLYVVQDDDELKYTMHVKTTFMEPGFQFGFQSKDAAIDLEITFFETANPDHILAKVKISKAPGAAHPDQGMRVADAYFTAAQKFGKELNKKYL